MKVEMYEENGWMMTRLSAAEEDTTPGAYVVIAVDVSAPNSYPEYMEVSSVFTEHFMQYLNESSDHLIHSLMREFPEQAEAASQDIFEAARLAGFSVEEAQDMAEVVLPDGGGSHG